MKTDPASRKPRRWRRRHAHAVRAAGVVVGGLALLAWAGLAALRPAPARANVILELAPTVGGGFDDNVAVTPTGDAHISDAFLQAGGSARLRYNLKQSEHALAYRFTFTHYYTDSDFDTRTHDLIWTSAFHLSARLTIRLTATGAYSQTSGLNLIDPATTLPTAVTVSRPFYSYSAGEDVSYQPTARTEVGETLSVSQIHYLDDNATNAMTNMTSAGVPQSTFINGALRAQYTQGLDAFTLRISVGDSISPDDPSVPEFDRGHTFFAQALAGWRRELSPAWSSTLQAGPAIIFKTSGDGVLAPAGSASLDYTRPPWFASLAAIQTPAPNFYLGQTTITDQITLRFAVPLNRSETFYAGAFGAYLYARLADGSGDLARAYDQITGGGSLILRFLRAPVFASLSYLAVSQRGSMAADGAPSLARQAVLLNITGTFAFGPGTPPLFGGLL